jgi:hypothetical protein
MSKAKSVETRAGVWIDHQKAGEFIKRISRQRVHGRIANLETADKMTDRQIAANVRRHFALKPVKPRKSSTSRKPSFKSMSPNPGRAPRDLGGEA